MDRIAINLFWVVVLLAAVGCWQEIRYEPKSEPAGAPDSEVAQADELGETEDGIVSQEPDIAMVETQSTEPTTLESREEIATKLDAVTKESPTDDDLSWLESTPEPTPDVPLASAWKLGSKWSLAVCIVGSGYGEDKYASDLELASAAADELQVTLPKELGEKAGALSRKEKTAWAIDNLLKDAGPALAKSMGEKHSPRHRALLELAVGTHALLLQYRPNREGMEPTAATIRELADEAQLPEQLWLPVVAALDGQVEFKAFRSAVFNLHRQAASHLEGLNSD